MGDKTAFNTEMRYKTYHMWDFEVLRPDNGQELRAMDVRGAIFEKFDGLTDYAIQMAYGDRLKLEWFEDPNRNGQGRWIICNVSRTSVLI